MFISRRGFFLVTLLTLFAQYLLHRHLRVFVILPDLLLIYVIFVNLVSGNALGLAAAFLAGLYQDFLLYAPPGGNSIVYLAAAYPAGRLTPGRTGLAGRPVFTLCACLSFFAALLHQLLEAPSWSGLLFWKPFFFALVNATVALPVFALYRHGIQGEETHGPV